MAQRPTAIAPSATPFRGEWALRRFSAEEIRQRPAIWGAASETLLRRAWRHCDWTPAEMGAALVNGQLDLWSIHRGGSPYGAVVTQINTTVRGRECIIVLLGGRGMKDWLHLLAEIEAWARSEGCIAICVMGRRGWKRVLTDFRETGVILTKEL